MAEADNEVEEGERGEEMVEVASTPTWSLWQGIVVSVEAGRERDHREEVVKEKDTPSLVVVKVEKDTGDTRGTRDQVGKGAATCDETLEKKEVEKDTWIARVIIGKVEEMEMTGEDMMTGQGGAKVKTGKVKEIKITEGDMMTGQGRRKGVL